MSHAADQLEGFQELLSAIGHQFIAGSDSFSGILKRQSPETEEFDLTPTDDDSVLIAALRNDVPGSVLRVGSGFSDHQGFFYRVTRIVRLPHQQIVQFECIVLNP